MDIEHDLAFVMEIAGVGDDEEPLRQEHIDVRCVDADGEARHHTINQLLLYC